MSSGGRAAVRMSEAEVEAFLQGSMKVQVATINPDGSPHLTTLFYVLHEGRIAFWTYASSQKIKNLERDDRITCLVEDGTDYFELRGVSITGHATLVTDQDEIREIGSKVATRMVGATDFAELGDLGRTEVERQVRKRYAVIVEPSKVASWDHRKMTLG